MPETIFVLTAEQALAHQQEVLLQFLIFFTLRTQLVHAAYDGGIHPTVTTAPVAVLTILFLVRWYVVGIAPPQTVFGVEQTTTTLVTSPAVHLHGVVAIFLFASNVCNLHVEWHSHLYGINPGPPAVQRVHVGLGLGRRSLLL